METRELTIHVSKHIGALLEEKAKGEGKKVSEYVEDLIERDVERRKVVDEVLAPIRKMFAQENLSETDLDALIDGERQAAWEEKQKVKARQ
jgi:hypothetical protein